MPALDSASILNTVAISATDNVSLTANTSALSNSIEVVCAWPVSGQYGPGSRVLYYVLVTAAVLARKKEWLRNACLAVALLWPAVAALHGIVLAALHQDGAVDMDIYGAFQLCGIGILAAPSTVRISQTYFNNPGRNMIFLWTVLLIAGLLSLVVELYRANATTCTQNSQGEPFPPGINAYNFPYTEGSFCNLTCSIQDGPFSPMRQGSANNIYIIPAPGKLTFGTAFILAAACCIPAVLSLVSMFNKVLDFNWKMRFGRKQQDLNDVIEGTNGATEGAMRGVESMIRGFLNVVEVPMFAAIILTILILGEMNFFSPQVDYQTEPIQSIGQWAPIVGTGLAALGSFYLLLAIEEKKAEQAPIHNCTCAHDHHGSSQHSRSSRDARGMDTPGSLSQQEAMQETGPGLGLARSPTSGAEMEPGFSHDELVRVQTKSSHATGKRAVIQAAAGRHKVAKTLNAMANYLGAAAHMDDTEFKRGKALDFPELPGEQFRSRQLQQIRETYNQHRDPEEEEQRRSRSRAPSFRVLLRKQEEDEVGSSPPSPITPTPSTSHASTMPVRTTSSSPHNSPHPHMSTPRRRDTLKPPPVHYGPSGSNPPPAPVIPIIAVPPGQDSPGIVVSPEPGTSTFDESLRPVPDTSVPEPLPRSPKTGSPSPK